jgi:hypothetical protein
MKLDRSEINRALAKAIAYSNAAKTGTLRRGQPSWCASSNATRS